MLEEGVRDLASLPVTAVAWTKYSLNNWYRQRPAVRRLARL